MFGKSNKDGGIMNVIRCDETDYLIWKWHPKGVSEGESLRENGIRFGSSLRVKDGSVAVFVYKQNDSTYQEFIEGPFDEILLTKNLPLISKIIGLAYNSDTPFQAEVYFINLAKIIQSKFAIPFFDVFDPRYEDFSVPVAVRGSINYKISDYKEFIKLHRLESFSTETFDKQVKDALTRYIKEIVVNIPLEEKISVIQLERYLSRVNDEAGKVVKERFEKDFGVLVSNVDVTNLEIDKTSDGYNQIKAITQDITSAKIKAQAEADLLNISGMQRINMADYEEKLRIQREENQYAQHLQTRSANINAYQVEKQAEVGIAGAEALGQMGANGAGNIDLGNGNGGSMGFNPAAMMTSMALGGTIGQNIAGTVNNIMSDIPKQDNNKMSPPPILYNVNIKGQVMGPFESSKLSTMAQSGELNKTTLVWRPGMSAWMPLNEVEELNYVLDYFPPSI